MIDTALASVPALTPGAQAAAIPERDSRLVLIEFTSPVTDQGREQLARAGVHLVRFIPENAFVARLEGLNLGQLRQLPAVAWAGPYLPDYKIHAALQPQRSAVGGGTAAAREQNPLEITVLMAPRTSAAELRAVKQRFLHAEPEARLRVGTVLRGAVPAEQLAQLAETDAVLWIEPAPRMKLFDAVSSKLVAGDGGERQLLTQALGYDGRGVTVAVADSGLNNGDSDSMHPDLFGRVTAFFQYGNLTDAADEHSHGTHVAGIVAGNAETGELDENGQVYGLGVAPGASIIAQRLFDGAGGYQKPPSFEKMTRDAKRAGADIGSNSWGDDTQGRYDVSAMEFDELVRDADALTLGNQEYILEFSAGNAGPGTRTIGSPAVAKNVIATGASGNDRPDFFIYAEGTEEIAAFSSRGPCEDGRIKPDVSAPGTWIASLQSYSAPDIYAWLPISPNYQFQGGTSQAGPHVSGAAAVFVQFYRESFGTTPSPALVKAALINSALDLDGEFGTSAAPNMDEGWGRIDLVPLVDPEARLVYRDQATLLSGGQVYEERLVIGSSQEPLKITLTYTDVPGFPGALPALVNDLDLEVLGPGGVLYRGNQFNHGESVENPVNGDRVNNVEGVYISRPTLGEYVVRVRAVRVPEDARVDTTAIDQDFALVCAGALARPGDSGVSTDRDAYRAPDRIQLTVIDGDVTGSVTVQVNSGVEPAGEVIALTVSGVGVYTGSVATVTGPAASDGSLQVAHGNTITVRYLDASQGVERLATAMVDLAPPVLSGVRATSAFGRVVVEWISDEPSDARVYFGTDRSALSEEAIDFDILTQHAVTLGGLEPGVTYYYLVASQDVAGNRGTNNNGGALFSFVVPPNRPVLLIDEYIDELFGAPPLSGYTNALDAAGLAYEVWDVSQQGEPTLEVLQGYRALLWRVPELTGVWSAAERDALRKYVAGGGGLFVASMEVLSRLEEAGDASFMREVLQVATYTPDPLSSGASWVFGSEFSSIGNGLDPVMDYAPYELVWGGLLGPDISDTVVPGPGAEPMFFNDSGEIVGLHWAGTNGARVVFCSFPLDAISLNPPENDRAEFMSRVMAFLLPDLGGGTLWLSSPKYTVPARVDVELAKAELAGERTVQVTASTSVATNRIEVTLYETPRRGFFRGFFGLLAVTNTASASELPAEHGAIITVEFTTPGEPTLVANAEVDTQPPDISGIAAESDYIDALVVWSTSEPTDGLVQFGESSLLGRTAYNLGPASEHGLTLTGLSPDRVYYYRVVSRDLAGNTRIDDNLGKLYTLRTLAPLLTPWSDNMDTGATNWSVVDAEESQPGWSLGTPQNSLVSGAHSPPLAWGSLLGEEPRDFVESFLVSPAIFLTNGNIATLSFWHAYDFTDVTGFDIELGELLLIANNGPAVPLASYGDTSGDWVEEQFDLTPYMGQMIYLAWHYVLFSFEGAARAGWVVDDVAIQVENVPPGVVEITNNIPQASFVLSGPVYRKGTGTFLRVTNAPPGRYLLEFADVPNYVTPAAQTNVLAAGGQVRFTGVYQPTIADPDTDGDGLTDAQEAIAGTNPSDPSSVFQVQAEEISGGLGLSVQTSTGRSYRVAQSRNGQEWTGFTAWTPAPSSGVVEFMIPIQNTPGGFLYRMEVRKD